MTTKSLAPIAAVTPQQALGKPGREEYERKAGNSSKKIKIKTLNLQHLWKATDKEK